MRMAYSARLVPTRARGNPQIGLAVFGAGQEEEQACLVRLQTGTWRIGRSC